MGFMIGLGHSATQCWIVKRTSPGLVEMHEQWDDIVTIRSGKGILRTGKMVTGNRKRMDTRQSKNWMGGTIVNPEVQHIKTGDFFLIPAMTGHQYIPDENDSLVYWTLKLRRVISRTQ
jgi:mannose-6-phosphate isomerase-like protein (cupin superfamily)